ncbi:MAG TPA: hypothetical protein VGA37_15345 [Gemmatimonadales bacterium]
MRFFPALIVLALSAAPLAAQVGPTPERLREEVVNRFLQNYRAQSGLSDEQFAQFQEMTRRVWMARRDFDRQERRVMIGLEEQMRPGIAADPDQVSALLDELMHLHVRRAAQAQSDQAEYAEFLNPVQRGQLVLAFMRLDRQIEQIMRERGRSRGNDN